ncbi:exodeoxyribonuclease VII small subunit [Gordonia sp. OPL2]|uniref:exodeoxyribonuclease VII small subunit n=1 Tax=Gordonia sp. OPL2 TaxID=2486274 RepID=UPI0016558670|nr:exodeoxyribonuclease VII small subunit [Gordonia sp. OPL2]
MTQDRDDETADDTEDWIPVEDLGYEQARDELVDVVATLEHGGLDLDASLALWERGEALATRCEEHLAGARARIEAAIAESDPDDDD